MSENKKPIETFYCGNISCSVWENDFEGKKSYQFTFQRKAMNPKTKETKYYTNFTPASMHELKTLVNFLANRQVKSFNNSQKQETKKPVKNESEDLFNPDCEGYNRQEHIEDIPF